MVNSAFPQRILHVQNGRQVRAHFDTLQLSGTVLAHAANFVCILQVTWPPSCSKLINGHANAGQCFWVRHTLPHALEILQNVNKADTAVGYQKADRITVMFVEEVDGGERRK